MNKTLIAIATAVLVLTSALAPSAQAGFKGRLAVGLAIGALGALHHQRYEERRWEEKRYVHRKAKSNYVAKKKSSDTSDVAKAEEAPKAEPVKDVTAVTENSSITVAALPAAQASAEVVETTGATQASSAVTTPAVVPAPTAAVDEKKTASSLDCKKFFPSVGLTLSVPCQ